MSDRGDIPAERDFQRRAMTTAKQEKPPERTVTTTIGAKPDPSLPTHCDHGVSLDDDCAVCRAPQRIWLHTGPFDPKAIIYFTRNVASDEYTEYLRADLASTGGGERVAELEAEIDNLKKLLAIPRVRHALEAEGFVRAMNDQPDIAEAYLEPKGTKA